MGLTIDTAPELAGVKPEWIDIRHVTTDDEMQPRSLISEDAIRRYKDALRHDTWSLPPILVADLGDDGPLVVIDGWHRFRAHEEWGKESIQAKVIECSRERAMWLAALANTNHGLPLKRGDQRRVFKRYIRADNNRKPGGELKSYREMVEDLNGMRAVGTIHKWTQADFPKLAAEMAKRGLVVDEEMGPTERKTSHAQKAIKDYSLGIIRRAKQAVKEDGEDLRDYLLFYSLFITENLGHTLGIDPRKMFEEAKEAEWRQRQEDENLTIS